jgi:predicted NUDIX family phosphoesterase/thymidylate kinase
MMPIKPQMNGADERARMKAIEELETLANRLRNLKDTSLSRRPIVIEFCGSPKAGKTSCINSLTIFLRRNGFRTIVVTERASVCPIGNKFDPSFNIWTGCSSLVQLAEILANHSRDYDVVVLDRGLFDAVCWFRWQKEHSKLDMEHYRRFVDFFLAPRWLAKIDILYIFKASPDVSMQREYATLLTKKLGSVMNPKILAGYSKSIDHCRSEYVRMFKRIREINTDSKGQDQVSFEVTKGILDTLDDLISERIAFVPKARLKDISEETFSPNELFDRIERLDYGIRGEVEKDPLLVQPLPVAVITDLEGRRAIVARKVKRATSENSPEKSRDLIYFGGHIRDEDETLNIGKKDIKSIASWALWRELKEELDVDYVADADPVMCIWDKSNPRSAKHVAIVYHITLDFDSLKIITDKLEFSDRGAHIVDSRDIFQKKRRFERWSQLILAKVLGWQGELI